MIEPVTISPYILYAGTFFIIGVLLLILLSTRMLLRQRKYHYKVKEQVQQIFDEWVSLALVDHLHEPITAPDILQPGPWNKVARQYAIDQLISTKKNLIGQAARNIIWLYGQLGLQKDSLAKFHKRRWHVKARGIYELYMMEQKELQTAINRYTNSRNEHVRMEAQVAVLAFAGFDGLRFLDTLTRPMSHWQQLKLIEQLTPLDPGNFEPLAQWLQSANPDVVIFALKLTDLYQQLQVREQVIRCLDDHNPAIRAQAIQTLVRVGDEDTPAVLVNQYKKEPGANKKIVLQSLEYMATDEQQPFLLQLLDHPDPDVKLQASRIILKCCTNGPSLLQQRAYSGSDVYRQIYLHLKNGLPV